MGVSLGTMVSGMGVSVGTRDGVNVGVGVSEGIGVDEGTVGIGRLRLSLTIFSTSAFSPIKVRRNEIIPFGRLDTFQE